MTRDMKVKGAGTPPFLLFIYLLTLPLTEGVKFDLFRRNPVRASSGGGGGGEARVRLYPKKCAGRVEVFHSGRWGTVCDDSWKKANSDVLCQEVGCGPVLGTRHGADPGLDMPMWLDDVNCSGNESSIVSCEHKPFGQNNCDHSEDAGVSCSEGMRLANGKNRCTGDLEIFRTGQWISVCDTDWNQDLSRSVCQQLECGGPKITKASDADNWGYVANCANGTTFSQCNMTKSREMCHGVKISCEDVREIRLVNGSNRCAGRVELFHERRWGTVCDDDWDLRDAKVVCKMMDCGAPLEAPYSARFGPGDGDIWLDNVECAGNESSLLNCQHNAIGDNNCGHGEDASVVCESQIRLINGTTDCSGRVEFFRNGQWSSARGSTWGKNQATVVCRQMNCGEASTFSGSNSAGEPKNMFDVSCTGDESALAKCTITEFNQTGGVTPEDATVVCSGNVLLSEGPNRCAGRVEVFHKGQWADISTDLWDMNAAAVVCRQLNCGEPHKLLSPPRRAGGSVWLNRTFCRGHEKSLMSCSLGFTNQTYDGTTAAGIICSEGLVVRLVNGQDRCSGRVEVRRGDEWGTLCDSGWNLEKAKFVCDLLECGHAVNASRGGTFPQGIGPVLDPSDACFSSLTAIHHCSLTGFRGSTCRHDRDAGLVCGGDSSIKLVNGTDRCSGRVEILYNAKWGTVCDDSWDINDAQVVCRSKDCGSAIAAIPSAFFGQGTGHVWLDDVDCRGNETSLVNCSQTAIGHGNCGHGEDAGVICSAHLRLFGGPSQCSGNVEIFQNGEWGPAVSAGWGRNEVAVICREMNCGDAMSTSGSFSQAELPKGVKVKCTGRESSVSQCSMREYTAGDTERLRYATVTCSGIVRLSDGPNRCAGRVEIFHNGQWGNVCGGSWDMGDAKVICQQLNCGNAFKLTTQPDYGQGSGVFLVEHLECQGRESLLQQCNVRHGGKECNSSSIAGVVCADSMGIRLVEGSDRCTGRVEVRMGSVWGSVCGTDWTIEKAELVCELLDCGHAANVTVVPHKASTQVSSPPQTCYRDAQSLKLCVHRGLPRASCAVNFDASVTCAEQIRLADGPNSCAGRVEVFYKGEWGSVCDDDWDIEDARVVCRQMGCGAPAAARSSAFFGPGSGPVWLDDMHCRGSEQVLTQCSHNGLGNHNCGHEEDAGVTCLDLIEKPKLLMSPGTNVNWGDRLDITCTISAQHSRGVFILRKSNETFKTEKYTLGEAATFTFQKADFSQGGFFFCEYKKNVSRDVVFFPRGEAMQLKITVTLQKPSIGITSSDPMLMPSKEHISITRGQSFNITCTVQSSYPGGFFFLTKANVRASESKPAGRRSELDAADFVFSAAQFLHQGNYSCIYGVNMSSRSFQSETSRQLRVDVLAGSSAATGVVVTLIVLAVLLGLGYVVWKKQLWKSTSNITDNMVTFVNRIGGAIQGIGNNSSAAAGPTGPASFNNEVYMDGIEDPPGTVCPDHEPLVLTK